MTPDANQIQLSAASRGIADHFFCFTCDEYVWDCDHLIDERLWVNRVSALEGSQLQSFAYEGKSRTLEVEFQVTAPFAHNEIPLPPPPKVLHYFGVPRYIYTKLIRYNTGRRQEQSWVDLVTLAVQLKSQSIRFKSACAMLEIFGMDKGGCEYRRFITLVIQPARW